MKARLGQDPATAQQLCRALGLSEATTKRALDLATSLAGHPLPRSFGESPGPGDRAIAQSLDVNEGDRVDRRAAPAEGRKSYR